MSKHEWESQKYRAYGYRPSSPPQRKRRGRGRVLLLFLILLVAGAAYLFVLNPNDAVAPIKELVNNRKQEEEARQQRLAEAVAADNQKLESILSNWTAAHPSHDWAVVIQGLDGDERTVSMSADTSMRAASLYKIFLLLGLFKEKSVPELKTTTLASGASLDVCTDKMLRISDNPCGEAIGEHIGWANADAAVRTAGFSVTKLNVAQPITTAGETARLMAGLHNKSLFTADQSAYTKGKLAQQTWNKGIPAGCVGCKTYNKTGDLGSVRHDAAIVENSGGSYVLVIFSDGALYNEIAELAAQINEVMKNKVSV